MIVPLRGVECVVCALPATRLYVQDGGNIVEHASKHRVTRCSVPPHRQPAVVIDPLSRLQPCGTVGGYQRHRRNDEPACDACRNALRIHSAERRAAA